jgi:hypothetical protein
LALTLALVVLATFYAAVAVPVLDLYASNAATAETRRALVAKLNAIARELPPLRARVAELRVSAAYKKLTLDGASDAIASAALQSRIDEIASSAGVMIASTESLPIRGENGYHRLGLRIVLKGGYDGLVKLLAGLERAEPPLVVDNLQIRSFQKRPGMAPVSALDTSLDVFGFRVDEAAVAKQ